MAGMRASRLADQTSKLVSALADRAAKQPLLKAGPALSDAKAQAPLNHSRQEPIAPIHAHDDLEQTGPLTSSTKRKRGGSVTQSPDHVTIKEETTETRISPRNATSVDGAKPKKVRRLPAKKIKAEDGTFWRSDSPHNNA